MPHGQKLVEGRGGLVEAPFWKKHLPLQRRDCATTTLQYLLTVRQEKEVLLYTNKFMSIRSLYLLEQCTYGQIQ